MRLGALLTPGDPTNPDYIAEQASAIEAAGYDSIWSAQAMGRGFMMADPFIALSQAAAVTQRVELGTAIVQLPLYNPTDVALKSYTLQMLSGNRFLLGIGVGSTESDFQIHGSDYGNRFDVFEDRFNALQSTFEDGSANGGQLAPPPNVNSPKLFFGTWGKNVSRAAAEFDGWIASGMHRSPDECADALTRYRKSGGGRAIVSTIQVTGDTDLGELQDRLDAYASAGFDDAVVMIFPGGPTLDEVRGLCP